MFTYVGNQVGSDYVGTALKTASGWYSQTGDAADRDAYGFAVFPAGMRYDAGHFFIAGFGARFWSSTEDNSDHAYGEYFNYNTSNVEEYSVSKTDAYSVRCLKD